LARKKKRKEERAPLGALLRIVAILDQLVLVRRDRLVELPEWRAGGAIRIDGVAGPAAVGIE
jgi:hypothetical protein